jgi:hypothetical protein
MFALLTLILISQAGVVPSQDAPGDHRPGDVTIGGYLLQANHAGGYFYRGDKFSAFLARDGSVRFEDQLPLPGQTAAPALALGGATAAALPLPKVAGGGGIRPARSARQRFVGSLASLAERTVTRPTLLLNDEELRRDPHHAAKMSFLDATAALREGLRVASVRQAERAAFRQLRDRVAAIANDQARPLPERRRLVYELWHECEESPSGQLARAEIVAEVRRRFAADSPRAYPPGELAKLNAGQQSKFLPYGPSAP